MALDWGVREGQELQAIEGTRSQTWMHVRIPWEDFFKTLMPPHEIMISSACGGSDKRIVTSPLCDSFVQQGLEPNDLKLQGRFIGLL